jgi:hypothetical protein
MSAGATTPPSEERHDEHGSGGLAGGCYGF